MLLNQLLKLNIMQWLNAAKEVAYEQQLLESIGFKQSINYFKW